MEPDNKQTSKSSKLFSVANTIRALSTVVVLVVPLIAGVTAIIGCGVYKTCKKIKR